MHTQCSGSVGQGNALSMWLPTLLECLGAAVVHCSHARCSQEGALRHVKSYSHANQWQARSIPINTRPLDCDRTMSFHMLMAAACMAGSCVGAGYLGARTRRAQRNDLAWSIGSWLSTH